MIDTIAQKRVLTRTAIVMAFIAHWFCMQVAHGELLDLKLDVTAAQPVFSFEDSETNQEDMQVYHSNPRSNLGSKWRERESNPLNIVRIKADRTLRIRGWQLRKNVYFGQAKVANQWGVGLLIKKRTYQYGINNRGIAFLKKF